MCRLVSSSEILACMFSAKMHQPTSYFSFIKNLSLKDDASFHLLEALWAPQSVIELSSNQASTSQMDQSICIIRRLFHRRKSSFNFLMMEKTTIVRVDSIQQVFYRAEKLNMNENTSCEENEVLCKRSILLVELGSITHHTCF